MNTTDKGLKKALSQQPDYRLPSNFSYRMMQKIHQETLLREKRQEKRLFILMLVTTFLAIGGCLILLCWQYGNKILSLLHILQEGSPSLQTCLFYLPILCALFLLFLFDRWLRKKRRILWDDLFSQPCLFENTARNLFPVTCQFFSLELADEVEMFFHFSLCIVHIHIQ